MDVTINHHSHSGQFCKHATGTLEAVVQEAIRQGFEVYGLTEHVPRYRTEDLYPEERDLTLDDLTRQFDAFVAEARRVQASYTSQIRILVGLETEHICERDLDGLSDILERHKDGIDYLVGSVHHVHGIPIDFDRETFQQCLASIPDSAGMSDEARTGVFLEMYFDAQYEVMQRFKPEIIGHIDLCRLYTPTLDLRAYAAAWSKLTRNVEFAVAYDALFEVNAAAFRKGWDAAYPGREVVGLILQHGGRFALSDDSHGPHAVGLNYGRMRAYMLQVGVRDLWVLRKSEVPNAGGRRTAPVKVEGSWWEHAFWDDKDGS